MCHKQNNGWLHKPTSQLNQQTLNRLIFPGWNNVEHDLITKIML